MRPSQQAQALKVQAALGPRFNVVELDESTHTSQEAADAIGCDLAQIAKSIIFRAKETDRAVLVIASGINRVDEKKVRALLGERIERAAADFVRGRTGFAIGGVPPVGHATPPVVFIDQDLGKYPTLWAAGGTPNAVFEASFADVVQITGGAVADVRKD
jgi:prolyl-tRNA editing enzyme YbaK/EbsC (Cys-tRNA(Pro) deacylase)